MNPEKQILPLQIILAEDDSDDRFFFTKALSELEITTQLTAFHDGDQLMKYLTTHYEQLPDVIFLDINMPRKSGYECMREIKENNKLKDLFVVMFSTFYSRHINYEQEMLIQLHGIGMDDFIKKPHNFEQLKEVVLKVLTRAKEKMYLNKKI